MTGLRIFSYGALQASDCHRYRVDQNARSVRNYAVEIRDGQDKVLAPARLDRLSHFREQVADAMMRQDLCVFEMSCAPTATVLLSLP